MICCAIVVVIVLYTISDVNYFLRAYFQLITSKFLNNNVNLNVTTTIYGLGTFQEADIGFRKVREDRLVRELDFARYHFYLRTGIYQRSSEKRIRSLQGCTYTVFNLEIPLFTLYKIKTKLVFWDDCSLFFEHEVETLHDGKIRALLVSRQHAIGKNGDSTSILLQGLPGSDYKGKCPNYIDFWLKSMKITSEKLRRN